MSPSSSGSWGGAGADIIDLDRYMRGNVRPSRTLSEERELCDRLVVDGGGIGRKLIVEHGNSARYKHHSHDSGVSDGSYDQRRLHRPRRASHSDGRVRVPREEISARTFNGQSHSDSLRAFRTVCEQAILDQQKQIARVTQLCERLTERAENERLIERPIERNINERLGKESERLSERLDERVIPNQRPVEKIRSERSELLRAKRAEAEPVPSETSDISSSSRSTKDLKRKEKNRTQECKTYKIIMTKLDELNRRFNPPRTSLRVPRPRTPSSSSVSVCDKLTATDPERTVDKVIRSGVQKNHFQSAPRAAPAVSAAPPSRPRVVAQAYNVDIAPRDVVSKSPNVATESVVKCESSCESSSSTVGDPRCNFDLEDPVHLYSQAKRLQTLNATTRRGRSHSSADNRSTARVTSNVRCDARASTTRARSPSICSVCRGYWRSLRHCLVGPFTQDCKCS